MTRDDLTDLALLRLDLMAAISVHEETGLPGDVRAAHLLPSSAAQVTNGKSSQFGFLDPVFSSGLFLALKGGELAGDAVHAALSAGDVSARRFEAYGAYLSRGLSSDSVDPKLRLCRLMCGRAVPCRGRRL